MNSIQELQTPPVFEGDFSVKQSKFFGSDPLEFLIEGQKHYGDIYYAFIGVRRTIVVNKPEYLKEIWSSQKFDLGPANEIFKKILGNGLGTVNGEVWSMHNKLSRADFTPKKMLLYLDTMHDSMTAFLDGLAGNSQGSEIDLVHALKRMVLISSFKVYDYNASTSEVDLIVDLYDNFLDDIIAKIRNPFSRDVRKEPEKNYEEIRPAFNKLIDDVIAVSSFPTVKRYQDQNIKYELLRDQIASIVITGYGSVVYAIDSILIWMSTSQKVLDDVKSEINEQFHQPVDVFQLKKLINAVNEGLRMSPPAWMVYRTALEDTTIGPYKVPKGTEVLLSIYGANHHLDHWSNPFEYNPDRFNEYGPNELKDIFMPFGAGRRACLGTNMAMQEILMFIAVLFKKYEVEFLPGREEGFVAKLSVMFKKHYISLKKK